MDDLRLLIRMKNIPIWKIALKIGVSEMTIYRWLRVYDKSHHEKIMNAVEQIERGDSNEPK